MDERTWQKANNPRRMLQYLAGWASERKRRLLACACCRRIWPLLPDARSRRIVEIVEHFAAGLTTVDEFRQAQHEAALCANEAERKRGNRREESLNAIRAVQAAAAQWHWAVDKVLHFTQMARTKDQQADRAAQSDLIRELFGNP